MFDVRTFNQGYEFEGDGSFRSPNSVKHILDHSGIGTVQSAADELFERTGYSQTVQTLYKNHTDLDPEKFRCRRISRLVCLAEKLGTSVQQIDPETNADGDQAKNLNIEDNMFAPHF